LIYAVNSAFCKATVPFGSVDSPSDETRAFEHFQVSRDGGLRHGKGFRQFHHSRLAFRETGEDGATG
jgi:hypothetical protein